MSNNTNSIGVIISKDDFNDIDLMDSICDSPVINDDSVIINVWNVDLGICSRFFKNKVKDIRFTFLKVSNINLFLNGERYIKFISEDGDDSKTFLFGSILKSSSRGMDMEVTSEICKIEEI